MLIDRYQRTIDYLRISVTDRCNFRCVYCMPAGGVDWKSHGEILTYEEITEFVRVAASLGIRRVRITGGEPLVRRNLAALIASIAAIPEIDDIALTTNATLLEAQACDLASAGLKRVNVSLDTLDAEKFARITRGGTLEQVWRGIRAAEAVGIGPIKINAVVVRGVNDGELLDLARLTLEHAWQVRFIEFMPVANGQDWGEGFPAAGERYLSIAEMRKALAPLNLEPSTLAKGSGPARIYRVPTGQGTIGFISPLGEHFCGWCNRLRLTADGNLRPCLLSDLEIPVRDAIRQKQDLEPIIRQAIGLKPEGHTNHGEELASRRKMAQIGG